MPRRYTKKVNKKNRKKSIRKIFKRAQRGGDGDGPKFNEDDGDFGKYTFAAQLGIFILSADDKIAFDKDTQWSEDLGFYGDAEVEKAGKAGAKACHPAIFGVLPFLHLNISEEQLKDA